MDGYAEGHMPVVIGPDGFLCSRSDPHYAFHAALNEILVEQTKPGAGDYAVAGTGVERLKKQFSERQLIELVTVIIMRKAWVTLNANDIAQPTIWRDRLHYIRAHLYRAKLPFTAADLCRLMPVCDAYLALIDCLVEHFKRHGLTPELSAELRRFRTRYQESVGGVYGVGADLLGLQRLNMLLWHDEWDELDLAACWSERVRRDYRAMTGDRRARWRALLHHIRGDAGSKPAKPWAKEAEKRLAAVGIEDFRTMIRGWFDAFRSPEPLPLSLAGSHVLKGLLWYGALARDAAVNEAALWLLDASWKPKRNVDKVMVALAVLIDTMPTEEAWQALLRLQDRWGASEGQIEKLLVKIAGAFGLTKEKLEELELLKPAPPKAPMVTKVLVDLQTRDGNMVRLRRLSLPQSADELLTMLKVLQATLRSTN
jgi:hypothetical protein